ncbi:MAG TPA: radical SAM protein [Pseudomonadota bacterium]|nr:radical SAM protein [Pseudomonadota bacterium]
MHSVRFLQIEPTTRCNFTCGFCCGRYMEQADLPFDRFETLLAAHPSVEHVELQGEGESLLHPRFFDMVRALRAKNIKVSLISNGSLMSESTAEELVSLGIEKVSVSMESADPETFRQIRGGKLEKVIAGLSNLMEARRKQNQPKPLVGLSVTVLRDTQDHFSQILSLYKKLGLDGGLTVQPLSTMPLYQKNYPEGLQRQVLSDSEVDDLWVRFRMHRQLRNIQAAKDKLGIKSFYDELLAGFQPGKRRCPWLTDGLYVNHQGIATACCMVKDTENQRLGVIGSDGMDSILAARQKLAEELASGVLPKPCAGCELGRFSLMSRWQLVAFALGGVLRTYSPRAVWARLRPSKPKVRLPLLP